VTTSTGSTNSGRAVAIQGDEWTVVPGYTSTSGSDEDVFAARYYGVSIFGNGFESGGMSQWSTVTG
jgi:hypothetical protein